MKNIGTLFRYELKKIWKQPLTWVTAALMTTLSVFVAQGGLQPNLGHYFYGEDAADPSSGSEPAGFISEYDWSARMQEGGLTLHDQIMDDSFFQAMRENIPDLGGYKELERWFYYEDPTYYHAWSMADSITDGDPRNVTEESFYAGRRALLERRWENYGLSEREKDYWRAMEAQVQEPFVYEYPWRGSVQNGLFTTL